MSAPSTDVAATRLALHTGSGDVTIRNVDAASLSADTGSGDVQATGLASAATVVQTGSGDVHVAYAWAPRTLREETGKGDLTVRNQNGEVNTTGVGDRVGRPDRPRAKGRRGLLRGRQDRLGRLPQPGALDRRSTAGREPVPVHQRADRVRRPDHRVRRLNPPGAG